MFFFSPYYLTLLLLNGKFLEQKENIINLVEAGIEGY